MSKGFLIFGRLEGLSFLSLLLIAMPIKYLAENPTGVRLMGPIHGILFLIYIVLALWECGIEKWPLKKLGLAILAAVMPFGTFLFEHKFASQNPLSFSKANLD